VKLTTLPSFAGPLVTTFLDQLFVLAIYKWWTFRRKMTGRSPKKHAKLQIIDIRDTKMATHRSEVSPELIIPEGKIGRNILVVR
jgi:hypothetical protein